MSDENLEQEIEEQIREKVKKQTGEWSICCFLVFLAAIIVLVVCSFFEHVPPNGSPRLGMGATLETIFLFKTSNDFPVDIAAILLIICIISSFCGLISLVADKSNGRTWLMRLFTLGPLLPIFFTVVMVMLISSNYNDNSILQDIIGSDEATIIQESND